MRAAVPWTLFAASLVVNVVFLGGVLMSGGRQALQQTAVELPPGAWHDVLTGGEFHGGTVDLSSLLGDGADERPAAVLEHQAG